MPRASIVKVLLVALFVLGTRSSSAQEKALTLRLAGDEWFLNSLTRSQALATFEKQSGIPVEVVEESDHKIMAELDRTGKPDDDLLDVIVIRHRLLGKLVQKGQVVPIDAFLRDRKLTQTDFTPQRLFPNWWRELSSYEKHTYGFPFTCLTTFLCYRKDLLEDPLNQSTFRARYHRELKPPTTWPEYTRLAEFFTRPDDHFYGTYIQGRQSLALWYEWLNLMYSFGGNILDTRHGWEYGDIVVNSPENVAATKQYVSQIAFSPPDTLTYGWDHAQSALQQGRVFMGLLWIDQAPFLEDPKVSKVAGKIGYSFIPSNTGEPFSQLEGLTYLIPKESKHAREAYRFLEWVMSEPVQVQQTLQGGSSALRSTYANTEVKALPYTSAFLASIPVGISKPTVPESDEMTQAAVRHLADIVSGSISAREGLDQLALDLQRILGGKAKLRYPVKTQ